MARALPPLSPTARRALLTLGATIKRLRTQRQMKQIELAQAAGYRSHSPISRLERGLMVPNTQRLLAIADYLGVSMAELWRAPDA